VGGDAEESSEDIEEAELDEARKLMEARYLDGDPAEFLAEQDPRERRILNK
jgi:hypothetical protein